MKLNYTVYNKVLYPIYVQLQTIMILLIATFAQMLEEHTKRILKGVTWR